MGHRAAGTPVARARKMLDEAARSYARASYDLHVAIWTSPVPRDLFDLDARVHDALEDLKAAATAFARIRHAKSCECLRKSQRVYAMKAAYRSRLAAAG